MKRKILSISILLMVTTIAGINATAQITTWDQLYTAFQNGGDVTLTQDITYSGSKGPLVVPKDKKVTLDLNGYTINRALTAKTKNGNVITVNVNGTLTIKDDSGKKTGKITGAWNNAKGGGVINNGTLILENGIICGNRSDVPNVNVTLASDETNRTGGAGVFNNGTMTMNGGSISGNISGNYGGGVLNSKTFTINGGLISENTAVNSGGGIANFGLVVQNGGQLFNNEAKNGGGVYNTCDGSDEGYKMEKGFVYSNIAKGRSESDPVGGSGGGFYIGNDAANKNATYYIKPGCGVYGNLALDVLGKSGKADEIGQTNSQSVFNFPKVEEMINTDGSPMEGYWYSDNPDARYRNGKGTPWDKTFVTGKVYVAVGASCPWCALQDKINEAVDGSAITLTQDYLANIAPHKHNQYDRDADYALIIPEGKTITIDLNGHTIDRNLAEKDALVNGNVFYVSEGASLTITDSSVDSGHPYGKGVITGGNEKLLGGAIFSLGKLVINAGNISKNCAEEGGGIFIKGGSFNMSGGIVTKNVSSNSGGGLSCRSAVNVIMTGGVFTDNQTKSNHGGGLYFDDDSVVELSNLDISNNSATISGGGILFSGKNLTMNDCKVHDNSSTSGGGVFLTRLNKETTSTATLIKCEITSNNVSGNGGGLYIESPLNICQLQNCNISDNESEGHAGGIYNAFGSLTIPAGNAISGNIAKKQGGGLLCAYENSIINITGASITGNKADEGGAVYVTLGGIVNLSSGEISGNEARLGGGVCLSLFDNRGGIMNFSGGKIEDNKATENGGGVFIDQYASLNISNGSVTGNTTSGFGNGIYQSGSMLLSGSPAFGKNQIVYLPAGADDDHKSQYVITKVGDFTGTIPVKLGNELVGRDILVSKAGASSSAEGKVTNADLSKLDVVLQEDFGVIYNAAGRDSGVEPKDVIELAGLAQIIIQRANLAVGESAVYNVFKDGSTIPAFTVSVQCTDDSVMANCKITKLAPGSYEVKELGWDWTYEKKTTAVTPAEQKTDAGAGYGIGTLNYGQILTFTFDGEAKTDKLPKHGEHFQVNKFE